MNTRLLTTGAIAFAILAIGGVTFATQNAEPEVRGSVTASRESGAESETDRNLEELAKIDGGAAEDAALEAVPGEAGDVELENEGGSVVYEVEIAGDDGRLHEVVVDAGNGDVLAQEIEDDGPDDDASEDDGTEDEGGEGDD